MQEPCIPPLPPFHKVENYVFSSFFNRNCIFSPTKYEIWKIICTFAPDFYTYHSLTGRFWCGMTTGAPAVERGFPWLELLRTSQIAGKPMDDM